MAKKSNKYWQKRFEQLEAASHKEALEVYSSIEQAFYQAQKEIENKITSWYVRFANNNKITMQDAKRLLNADELKELKWNIEKYIDYGEKNAISQEWLKELENASAKFHISRLEALKLETQQSMEKIFGNELDEVDKLLTNTYQERYYRSCFELQKGFEIGWKIAAIDNNKLKKIISKPWAVDGRNFSERIWGNKIKMINELHNQLTIMCIQGKAPDNAIKYMAKKFKTSKQQAGNLIMTESAYFSSLAQKDCFNNLGVEKYENVATLDTHTSETCQEMDGTVFEMKNYEPGVTAPPFHNYCRTVTAPYFDDNYDFVGSRIARDPDGKQYQIPENLKYNDWKEEYINSNLIKAQEFETAIKMNKNRASDLKQYERYQEVFKNGEIPSSFEKFQKMKYNNKEYEYLKEYYKLSINESLPKDMTYVIFKNNLNNNNWQAVGFNPHYIEKHKKHLIEFDNISWDEYEQKAKEFLNSKDDGNIVSFISEEGTRFKYNISKNEFACARDNGITQTYYKPIDKMKYWEEQVEKYGKK